MPVAADDGDVEEESRGGYDAVGHICDFGAWDIAHPFYDGSGQEGFGKEAFWIEHR